MRIWCLKCIYRSYVRSRTSYELITRIEGELGYGDTLPLVKELYPCAQSCGPDVHDALHGEKEHPVTIDYNRPIRCKKHS